ncbi:MAG: hypothetical protein K5931_00510 [Lachnospiraceae bacterium]|nr:hypothetical protein [Lachnospiraceae bacterium]
MKVFRKVLLSVAVITLGLLGFFGREVMAETVSATINFSYTDNGVSVTVDGMVTGKSCTVRVKDTNGNELGSISATQNATYSLSKSKSEIRSFLIDKNDNLALKASIESYPGETGTTYNTPETNTALYKYTVTAGSGGSVKISGAENTTVSEGSSYIILGMSSDTINLEAVPNSGNNFTGWSIEGTSSDSKTRTISINAGDTTKNYATASFATITKVTSLPVSGNPDCVASGTVSGLSITATPSPSEAGVSSSQVEWTASVGTGVSSVNNLTYSSTGVLSGFTVSLASGYNSGTITLTPSCPLYNGASSTEKYTGTSEAVTITVSSASAMEISGADTLSINNTEQYSVTNIPGTYSVTWSVNNDVSGSYTTNASINASSGILSDQVFADEGKVVEITAVVKNGQEIVRTLTKQVTIGVVAVKSITITNNYFPFNNYIYVSAGKTLSDEGSPIVNVEILPADCSYTKDDIVWSVASTAIASRTVDEYNDVVAVKGIKEGATTLKATIKGASEAGKDVAGTINIKVYKIPGLSYSSAQLSASLPDKVFLDLTSDDTNLNYVTGGDIRYFKGGTEIFPSSTSKSYIDSGRSFTVSSSELRSVLTNNTSKFTSNDDAFEARVYPAGEAVADNSDTSIKTQRADADLTVYDEEENFYGKTNVGVHKIVVTGDNITSSTTSGYYLEGEQVTIKAVAASGYKFSKWEDDGGSSTSRVVTVNSTNNTYRASATSTSSSTSKSSSASSSSKLGTTSATSGTGGTGGGAGEGGLDPVPKTGQGNGILTVIFLMLASSIGAVYYAFKIRKPVEELSTAEDESVKYSDEDMDLGDDWKY